MIWNFELESLARSRLAGRSRGTWRRMDPDGSPHAAVGYRIEAGVEGYLIIAERLGDAAFVADAPALLEAALEEIARLRARVDGEGPAAVCVVRGYMGDPEQWCYFLYEDPDEGATGPFATQVEAEQHARRSGYEPRATLAPPAEGS